MRAVITGGLGFIGGYLVNRLKKEGWETVIVDDFSTHEKAVNYSIEQLDAEGIILQPVQRLTFEQVSRHKPIHAVFHLAGKVGPVGVLRFGGRIAQDTIDAASVAGDWAERAGVPLIDISTSEVYGTDDTWEGAVKQFRDASPRMEYAVSKLAAETMLLNRPKLDVRIIRPFNVTGPGQRPEGGFVLPRMIRQALADDWITVYTPGTQRRAFTHVSDIVDGIYRAYTYGKTKEIYNLGNPNNAMSIYELARVVKTQVGKGRIAIIDPQDIHGPAFKEAPDKLPSVKKARFGWDEYDALGISVTHHDGLGWEPKANVSEIVAEMIEDIRENG